MEIYQLRVFLEVARCLSFTEAAESLSLTQPAVSAKIKSLESELGTALFERLGRRIELTEVGEHLLSEGPQLIDLEYRLLTEIEEIKLGKFGTLKIGCLANVLGHWLPQVLYEYRRLYPDIQTRCLQFDSSEQLYRSVKSGDVDFGISDLSFSAFDEITETKIDSVHYSLALSSSHRLAQQPWLSLQELKNESWILLSEAFPSRIILNKRMQELGLTLANFAHVEVVDTPSLVRAYLLQGHYVSFVADFDFQVERQAGLISHVPLEEFALGTPLFLLMAKRLSRALAASPQSGFPNRQGLEPLRRFRALVQDHSDQSKMRFSFSPGSTARHNPDGKNAASTAKVPQFQAPSFSVRISSGSGSGAITLTIGTQNRTIQTITAGLIIQRLGLLEHFLPRDGRYSGIQYHIRWVDYNSGAPIVAGLEAKQLDIGVLGDYPLLLSAPSADSTAPVAGTRLISFVASSPDGTGNDIIVPNHSPLSCIEDLKGRVIAVPFGSAAHGMVMRSLHHRHLLDTVTLTSIDNLNAQKPLRNKAQIDCYAYFAPFHEIAKHKGQFRRLLQEPLDGLPTFHGVVIRDDLAEQYPEIAVAYLKALLAAQYWYATQPVATTLVSRWVNMDAAIVAKTLLSGSSSQGEVAYRPETQLRSDWLQAHIQQLSQITGQENLGRINLNHWVQPEFLESAIAAL